MFSVRQTYANESTYKFIVYNLSNHEKILPKRERKLTDDFLLFILYNKFNGVFCNHNKRQ